MSHCVVVIPSRYESKRLPGKPLLDETGKPLIVHVAEQAVRAAQVDDVIVAADDQRILDAVAAHDIRGVMTRSDHPNGSMRIAEVAATLPKPIDIVLNVQGDEPRIDPLALDKLIERVAVGEEPMATLAAPFEAGDDPANPNVVKVVCDQRGRAMYFSRSVIPFDRDGDADTTVMRHIGVYAFRRLFLAVYRDLAATPAEKAEKLEQLRVLEHGYPIAVVQCESTHHAIDTPEQYQQFVETYRGSVSPQTT